MAAYGLVVAHAMAADVPPMPPHYFNDYASLIDPQTAQQLDIISDEIAPRFRSGDFSSGMTAAVNAMIAATRGEYEGSGRTVDEAGAKSRQGEESTVDPMSSSFWWVSDPGCISFLVILGILGFYALRGARLGGTLYTRSGSRGSGGTWWIGGDGGGGGGGFSGGGGDSGGGGASGGW